MSRRRRLEQGSLFALSLLPLMMAASGATAQSLPSGGTVVSGAAAIGYTSANDMLISQTSGKAIINWGDFSIGDGKSVTFENGAGATLNRVTGANASNLLGTLNASGSVYLINPNGVIVGSTGVVNVGGTFVASTLNLTDANFLAGGTLTFQGASTAVVKNLGRVGALGGDVALIAATVTNEGSINAGGTAALAAGSKVTVGEASNNNPTLSVQVMLADASLNDGRFKVEIGAGDVTNIGAIQAAEAELRANGGNVYALAGNTGGSIDTRGGNFNPPFAVMSPSRGGRVFLTAGSGNVVSSGVILAGREVTMQGAQVAIAGTRLEADEWTIDANAFTIGDAEATVLNGAMAYGDYDSESGEGEYGGANVNIIARTGDIVLDTTDVTLSIADRDLRLTAFRNVTLNDAISATRTYNYPWGDYTYTGSLYARSDSTGTGTGVVTGVRLNEGYAEIMTNVADYSTLGDLGDDLILANPHAEVSLYALVNSYADLKRIATDTDGDAYGNFVLSHDIDASGSSAGDYVGAVLHGQFRGDAHTISNLQVTGQSAGLFAGLQNASVYDLTLDGGSATGTQFAGALAGWAQNSSISGVRSSMNVSNGGTAIEAATGGLVGYASGVQFNTVEVSGHVAGANKVGGIVGHTYQSDINSADFSGELTGANKVGGVVGSAEASSIYYSNVSGSITGQDQVGGVVGKFVAHRYIRVYGSNVSGVVTGQNQTGGVVGYLDGGWVSEANFSGVVTGGAYTGGVAGYVQNTQYYDYANGNDLQIQYAHVSGSVTGADYTGGLVGELGNWTALGSSETSAVVSGTDAVGGAVGRYAGGTLVSVNASGATTGSGYNVGGLVGESSGAIRYSSASGDVTGAGGVGGLVGYSTGAITNSSASGAVTGHEIAEDPDFAIETNVGGLVGVNYYGNINYSSASGAVSGEGSTFGGLVGYIYGATIDGSTATGAVSGQNHVGGLVGHGGNLAIYSSYASGAVTGVDYDGVLEPDYVATGTGGLVGYTRDSITITNSYANGKVVGVDNTGGLIGLVGPRSQIEIVNAWATGAVEGGDNVGGLIGAMTPLSWAHVSLNGTYASGKVTGNNSVGGLIGLIQGEDGDAEIGIANSYASGAVTGIHAVGGLIGHMDVGASITDGYATGAVSGTTEKGGLFGHYAQSSVGNLYWDTDSSGTTVARGNDVANFDGVTGLTRDQAFDADSYQFSNNGGWIFLNGLRPLLSSEASQMIYNAHQLQLASLNPGGSYYLGSDISAAETGAGGSSVFKNGFATIASFSGYLDGQGHTISNLTIAHAAGDTANAGLFGEITSNGVVYDLKLSGGSVTALGANAVGSIAGVNYGRIEAVSSSMTVNGNTASGNTGGLVGINTGQILASAYKGDVTGYVVGGLVGDNGGIIQNSYAAGSVTGESKVGGLVGYNHGNGDTTGVLDTVLSTATVNGESKVGALVGSVGSGTIVNGRWSTTVSGDLAAVGNGAFTYNENLVGYSTADLQDQNKAGDVYFGFDLNGTWALGSSAAASSDGQAHFAELYRADNILVVDASRTGTYGDDSFGDNYQLLGNVRGDTVDVTVDSSAYGRDTHAGTYQLGVQSTVKGSTNYRVVTLNTLKVDKRQVYVYLNDGVTKTYDGTNTVALTGDNLAAYNMRDGDTLAISGTGTYGGSAIGSGLTVTIDSLGLSGDNAGDYELIVDGPSANVGYINHAFVTGTVTTTKTYDGTTALGANATTGFSGLIGEDTLEADFSNVAFRDKNAGTGKTLTGTVSVDLSDSNYAVTSFDVAGTGQIDAKTITAGLSGTISKTYDGSTSATPGSSLSLSGLIEGDTVTVAGASAAYGDKNAGTGKTVTVNGATLGGMDAGNYVLASTTISADIGTILQKALTITANGQVKNRNDVDPTLTYVTNGLVTGETLTGALTRDEGEAVGTYDILQGTLSAGGNYAVTFNRALLTINLGIPPVENLIIPYIPADGGGSSTNGAAPGSGGAGGQKDGGTSVGFQLAVVEGGEDQSSTQEQGGEDTTTCAAGETCQSAPYTQGGSTSGAIHFQGFMH